MLKPKTPAQIARALKANQKRAKRYRLLPTSAPKPIPPEFMDKFVKHGWRRVENIWGKASVLAWRKQIGAKRMAEARKRYLKGLKG